MADPIIQAGLRARLFADVTVLAAVSGRIFFMLAPANTAMPYILFSHAAGGDIYETPKNEIDEDWDVKVIADDALEALTILNAIKTALNGASLTLTGGWASIACQHTVPFLYPETVDQRQYWHGGGSYRIRAVKES